MCHRKYTFEDQIAFAELSGDFNPLHMDVLAARRYLFGQPVVHGVHSVLWAVEVWLTDRRAPVTIRSLKASFLSPIGLGEEVTYSLTSEKAGQVTIDLLSRSVAATRIKLKWDTSPPLHARHLETCFPERRDPRPLLEDQIDGRSGVLDLFLNREAAARLFPQLIRWVPPLQIATILASTRLVGAECPGLNSINSELELWSDDCDRSARLSYEVTEYDKRFGMVSMSVRAPGMSGAIRAFVRPPPRQQASYLEIKREVGGGSELAGQRALVIGGSRGLGEVVAKLLAAGGAKVTITFHQGEEDARGIVRDIVDNGGHADSCHFDVLSPKPTLYDATNLPPTHLYYFATPFIFSSVKGVFSTGLFQKFCAYYVTGFINIVTQLKGLGLKRVFYPSSVAVDELPINTGEYSAAKMAGETLCVFLEKHHPGLTIYKPRLPRMATDQTASLVPVENLDPVPVLISHIRAFCGASSRARDGS